MENQHASYISAMWAYNEEHALQNFLVGALANSIKLRGSNIHVGFKNYPT